MPNLTACLIDITRTAFGLGLAPVPPTAHFANDLGADSIDCVELMMALEEKFEIEFADDEIAELTSVSEVANYLRHRAADAPAIRSLITS